MIKKWINILMFSAPVRLVIRVTDSIKPWGFEGLSLYFVMKFFAEGLQKGALTTYFCCCLSCINSFVVYNSIGAN
jgi:hypothetical protein